MAKNEGVQILDNYYKYCLDNLDAKLLVFRFRISKFIEGVDILFLPLPHTLQQKHTVGPQITLN